MFGRDARFPAAELPDTLILAPAGVLPAPRRLWRPRWSAAQRRRLSALAAISAVLHLAVLLAFLLAPHPPAPEAEWLPPPSVDMVFENGAKGAPAVPAPQIVAPVPRAPPASPGAPAPAIPLPPLPLPLPPVPPPTAVPLTAPEELPSVPAPPAAEPLPTPPLPPSVEPAPLPAAPAVRPLPRLAPARPRPAPPRASEFPAPMDFSLAPPSREAGAGRPLPARPRGSRGIDLSLGPIRQGPSGLTSSARISGADVGPDWGNELSAWVSAHAYYPRQAAMAGEDGAVRVHVVLDRYGQVHDVTMAERSGSQWLDMALLGMFRGARLPPLPPGTPDKPIDLDFTMHYILIRQ